MRTPRGTWPWRNGGQQWPPAYEGIQGPIVTSIAYPTEFRGGHARRKRQEKKPETHRDWREDVCPGAPTLGRLHLSMEKVKDLSLKEARVIVSS